MTVAELINRLESKSVKLESYDVETIFDTKILTIERKEVFRR